LVIGLTMIKVRSGQERSVYADLQNRPDVKDVYSLFGEYSFFVIMQAQEKNGLSRILSEIKERESVIKTGPVLFSPDGDRRSIKDIDPAKTIPALTPDLILN